MASLTTSHQVLVRPVLRNDAEAVADIHIAARGAAPMPPSVHAEAAVRAWLAQRVQKDEVWVAVDGDAVVGYVRFTDEWLEDLYIAPSHARLGIGTKLLDVVKRRRPAGFSLWVFEMNAPARAFYGGHGLMECEHRDGADNEERTPDLRMAWVPGR